MKYYRFTTNGEGVFTAGKRLLPAELVAEANINRSWLPKPQLPEGNYLFYLTEAGKEKYLDTLYKTHQKYLTNLNMESLELHPETPIIFEDQWQIVIQSVQK